MPQSRRKQNGPTKAEQRAADRRAIAEESVAGYEPRGEDDPIFRGSRGFVDAQFALAVELDQRYQAVLEERKVNREQLRGLQIQRLLTGEEAVFSHELYPARATSKDDDAEAVQAA